MQGWEAVTEEALLDCSYPVDGWAEQTPTPACLTWGWGLADQFPFLTVACAAVSSQKRLRESFAIAMWGLH